MSITSIRWRLPVSYAAIALLTAVVLGGILLLTLHNFYIQQERTYLSNSAQLMSAGLSKILEASPDSPALQLYIQNLSFLIQARIRLLDPQENVIADSGTLQVQQFIYTNLTPSGMSAEVLREGRAERYLFHVGINIVDDSLIAGDVGASSVLLSQLPTENTLCGFGLGTKDSKASQHSDQIVRSPVTGSANQLLGALEVSEGLAFGGRIIDDVSRAWAVSSSVGVIVAVGAGWLVSRRLVSPLTDLTAVTRQMTSGDLSARAQVNTKDEFGVLGRSFNTMAERVEDIVATLRSFVADAAHELHTPLTTLRVNLEMALDNGHDLKQIITTAQAQVARMQALVDSLLDLSRIESSSFEKSRLSLSEQVAEVSEKCTSLADRSGINYEHVLPEERVYVHADAGQLRRALENILDNAIKFTPAPGRVTVTLEADDQHAYLTVQDTGIGIPPGDLVNLCQRFHRGRNVTAFPGSGLGLAIVKTIVDRHGWDLKVNSDVEGTSVTIILPRQMEPRSLV